MVADLPEHPNVVSYYRGWQEGRQLHIQMEYCARGTLAALVHRWQASRQIPPEVEVWRVARDVAGTLAFIHAHGIVHLDVKPENVFLGENTFKLGDFGLAIRLGSGGRQDWEEGDGHYVAPELLASDTGLPTAAADLYSLGATLFECVTGARVPRSGRGSCALDQPVWDHFSAALRQLVQALLNPCPPDRPSAQDVLDGIAALPIGTLLPPLPAVNARSKGWHGEDPMGEARVAPPGPARPLPAPWPTAGARPTPSLAPHVRTDLAPHPRRPRPRRLAPGDAPLVRLARVGRPVPGGHPQVPRAG